ncbi:hypothetical protein ACFOY5_03965 [Massilia aurea]|uniref:hypothetical protein n=1 Tax=Massilia aurea TaxID=373040 RepID=UPI00216213D7|nr:hypothetical protein [Massilia aurea]MCS0707351.1 hypothetical protein [Massilia aurea]
MEDIIKEILTTAKGHGRIENRKSHDGGDIKIGSTDFGKGNFRNCQKYIAALEEMENQGLVKGGGVNHSGQVFIVTDKGYSYIGV